MLSSGTKAVQSSACLRCELRLVLQHLRPLATTLRLPYASQRTFSTIYSRQTAHDSEIKLPVDEKVRDVYYKRFSPGGRIVGKSGRKQRQTSEALATNSLGEKSEIVVFRDVIDTHKKPQNKPKESQDADIGEQGFKGLGLTPEEIKAAMSGKGQAPDEDDVNKSIEALRPQAPVIEQKEYDLLIKGMLDSYNMKQLSRYLSRSLTSRQQSNTVVRELEYSHWRHSKHAKAPKRTIAFTRSRWQPGRTPLENRRITEIPVLPPSRSGLSGPKFRAAERIVRVAWEVTTKLEEQRVGELEVQMMPWAIALFFDTLYSGKQTYQALIEPSMLLRRSEVRPYRLDNIIRITARRQDAEEIATQLENKVLLMGKQLVRLDKLISNTGATISQGQSLQYFRAQDIEEISRRTQAVFMQQSDGSIGIYSFKQVDRLNARRLMLSLLDLPSRNSKTMVLEASNSQQANANAASLALIPIFPDSGLHFRDRSKMFARAMLPTRTELPTYKSNTSYEQAEKMARDVSDMVRDFDKQKQDEPAQSSEESSDPLSYWEGRPFTTSDTWWVQLGLLLRETTLDPSGLLMQNESVNDAQSTNSKASPNKSLFLAQVPGFETLLSYFDPNLRPLRPTVEGFEPDRRTPSDRIARRSNIVAHFTPNPFSDYGAKALEDFPKLKLIIFRRYGSDSVEDELKIEGLRGIVGKQNVDIPLPEQAIDIRLSRKVHAYANLPAVVADPQVQQFLTALKESIKSGGHLQGTTEVTFKMPGWMGESDIATRKAQSQDLPEIPVSYMFERFEQVQTTGFRKNAEALDNRAEHSAGVRRFNKYFPRGARLEYEEIEAGEIGGRQTKISFKVHKTAPRQEVATIEGADIKAATSDGPVALSAILTPALAAADFITRVCRNEINAWRGTSGLPREAPQNIVRKVEMSEKTDKDVHFGEETQAGEEDQVAEEAQAVEEGQAGEEAQVGEEAHAVEETQPGKANQAGEEAQVDGGHAEEAKIDEEVKNEASL